jgi:hypothetical protein
MSARTDTKPTSVCPLWKLALWSPTRHARHDHHAPSCGDCGLDGLRGTGALGPGRSNEGSVPAPARDLVDYMWSTPRDGGRDSAPDLDQDGASMDTTVQCGRPFGTGERQPWRAPVGVPVRSRGARVLGRSATTSPSWTPRYRGGTACRRRGSRRPSCLERLPVPSLAPPPLAEGRAAPSSR